MVLPDEVQKIKHCKFVASNKFIVEANLSLSKRRPNIVQLTVQSQKPLPLHYAWLSLFSTVSTSVTYAIVRFADFEQGLVYSGCANFRQRILKTYLLSFKGISIESHFFQSMRKELWCYQQKGGKSVACDSFKRNISYIGHGKVYLYIPGRNISMLIATLVRYFCWAPFYGSMSYVACHIELFRI